MGLALLALMLVLAACAVPPTGTPVAGTSLLTCAEIEESAVTLTVRAYVFAGMTPAQARRETRQMRADLFFFWPAEFFLVEPQQTDAEFTQLKTEMESLWAASRAGHCRVAFHPVPEL